MMRGGRFRTLIVVCRLKRVVLSILAVIVPLFALSCRSQAGSDLLIMRDGGQKRGALEWCTGEICRLSGSQIPQSSILWIGLGGSRPPPPSVRDPARNELHLVDSIVRSSSFIAVDPNTVFTDHEPYARKRVAWIHLVPPSSMPGGTARPGAKPPGHGRSWVWDGRIEVENEYNGRNGEHKWRAEYKVRLLEERSDSHDHHVSGMGTHDVLEYDLQPLKLSYVFNARQAWDRGTMGIYRNAAGEIYNGDVHMNGRASGTFSTDQLKENEVLRGRVAPLDASGSPGEDPSYKSPADGSYQCDHPGSSPGWYYVIIKFGSGASFKKTRAYYRGIERTGMQLLLESNIDPDFAFLNSLPACMPNNATPAVGRLDSVDQASVRGERSFDVCGGISSGCPHDAPQRIRIKWSFDRKQK
jgi:hypothetical protein